MAKKVEASAPIKHPTWREMIEALMECETDKEVKLLMDEEKVGANRTKFLIRMQGRLTVLRRQREAQELGS